MTYEQARDIFEAKQYEDAPMRGRQSMSPLEKLGLIDRSSGNIVITDIGNKLLNNEITFDEFTSLYIISRNKSVDFSWCNINFFCKAIFFRT